MEACVQDAKAWLCDNGLVMNDNKSQATVIRSSSLRTPTSLTRVNIRGQLVDTSPVIRDLGFTIDSNLTMTSQVASVCRSAYYHLSRIAKIRDSVSTTGVDRWGTGDASPPPPHFSGWGDSIGIVPPPLFSSEKMRGM